MADFDYDNLWDCGTDRRSSLIVGGIIGLAVIACIVLSLLMH